MVDTMTMVKAERHAFADYLTTLTDDQWAQPTWCTKWTVQEVVGHLVAAGRITAGHFITSFLKAGFSFDKVVERDLVQYAQGTPAEVLARFNEILDSDRKPPAPGGEFVALGEIMCHGEDVRRALGGSGGHHPEEHLVALGNNYVTSGAPLRGKARAKGLKLVADDVDWTSGDGPEVRGPAMSLILAIVGRKGVLGDLSGEGLETLRARV